MSVHDITDRIPQQPLPPCPKCGFTMGRLTGEKVEHICIRCEQLTLGQELRDEGTARADETADQWWKNTADQAIDHLASIGRPFTADDVRDLGVPDPVSPKAWGSRFLTAARQGRIVRVGYAPSRRASVHAHPVAVWQGA